MGTNYLWKIKVEGFNNWLLMINAIWQTTICSHFVIGLLLLMTSCAKTHFDISAYDYNKIDTDRWFEYISDTNELLYKDTVFIEINCDIENGDLVRIRYLDNSKALVEGVRENRLGWLGREKLKKLKLTDKRPIKIDWYRASSDSIILE